MRKKSIIILFGILLIITAIISTIAVVDYTNKKRLEEEQNLLLEKISGHYNKFVITNKETNLYKNDNGSYIESGKINKDVIILLEDMDITYETKYFLIKDLNLYIYYEDVNETNEHIKDDRYTNYIYFNSNIITKKSTSFYDIDGRYLYTINESYDFKILIKDNDRYGVVFNDELLFVNKEDVEKTYDSNNTEQKNKNRIKTLTYHFIYNPETSDCNQSICHTLDQFESHLRYLKENNYLTLRLNELEWYMDGKLQIPEKSIVLTIDDGTIFDVDAIKLLEKYDLNATLFVITGWVGTDHLQSDNLDLESHTHNMHNQYECAGYGNQGGGILCLDEKYVLNDLKTSQENLNGSKYFAYPFYDFNDRAISLLKQAGFKLAFIGQYDTDGYSYPGRTDNFKLRRTAIFSDTTMNEFISYLK